MSIVPHPFAAYRLLYGDALARLRELPGQCVQCVVTSPPYWGLRDYGVDGQIGLESTPEEYVLKLVEVFREVRRVLRNDGVTWVNLGDIYFGSWGNYGGQNRGHGTQREIVNGSAVPNPAYDGLERYRPPSALPHPVLKPKDLAGIPWRLASALQADGWWLRSDVIWSQPNPMPESVTDRPTKSHEYVFLLAKSDCYFYDAEAIKEIAVGDTPGKIPPISSKPPSSRATTRCGRRQDLRRSSPSPGITSVPSGPSQSRRFLTRISRYFPPG